MQWNYVQLFLNHPTLNSLGYKNELNASVRFKKLLQYIGVR